MTAPAFWDLLQQPQASTAVNRPRQGPPGQNPELLSRAGVQPQRDQRTPEQQQFDAAFDMQMMARQHPERFPPNLLWEVEKRFKRAAKTMIDSAMRQAATGAGSQQRVAGR